MQTYALVVGQNDTDRNYNQGTILHITYHIFFSDFTAVVQPQCQCQCSVT